MILIIFKFTYLHKLKYKISTYKICNINTIFGTKIQYILYS
jgi:hypothetical protein